MAGCLYQPLTTNHQPPPTKEAPIKLIDLTMSFSPQVTPLDGHPHISLEPITTHEADGRSNTKVVFSIHTSTHIDAPQHFYADGMGIDKMPLDIFMGKAYLCDLRGIAQPGQAISVADMKAGGLPAEADLRGSRIVMYAAWAAPRWNGQLYGGNPYLSEETAHWFIEMGVAALALDFSVDGAYPYPCHQILLNAGIPLIENLVNLDQLPPEFTLIAFPLKIEGGDGAPARVVAMVE